VLALILRALDLHVPPVPQEPLLAISPWAPAFVLVAFLKVNVIAVRRRLLRPPGIAATLLHRRGGPEGMIYLTLFWTFFKIGAFTFGGGYAMLPLIQARGRSRTAGWTSRLARQLHRRQRERRPAPSP
jgi:hypothetical protein